MPSWRRWASSTRISSAVTGAAAAASGRRAERFLAGRPSASARCSGIFDAMRASGSAPPRRQAVDTQTRESADRRLVSQTVAGLSRSGAFPVVFGGIICDGDLPVTAIHGNRTGALDGLRVQPERGLGGRAMAELRPRMTADYRSAER